LLGHRSIWAGQWITDTNQAAGFAGATTVSDSLLLFVATVESMEVTMGRGILLWLLGVPIPIIILLALIWH